MQGTTKHLGPRFFFDHGGYYHLIGETIQEGRVRCAIESAKDQAKLADLIEIDKLRVRWEEEPYWSPGDMGDEGESFAADVEAGNCPPPLYCALDKRCECCGEFHPVASLGMIGLASEDDPYMRVVETELAGEYFRGR